MEAALREAGTEAERIEATTGDEAAESVVLRRWDTSLNAKFDRNCEVTTLPMSAGERGCAASHAALWKRCVRSGAPLLILEDDANLGCGFAVAVAQLAGAVEGALGEEERRLILYLGGQVCAAAALRNTEMAGGQYGRRATVPLPNMAGAQYGRRASAPVP